MRTIYKYTLKIVEKQTIAMPATGTILHIEAQGDKLCLWAEIETTFKIGQRTFCLFGTGRALPPECQLPDYVGTVLIGPLVWHVYEIK